VVAMVPKRGGGKTNDSNEVINLDVMLKAAVKDRGVAKAACAARALEMETLETSRQAALYAATSAKKARRVAETRATVAESRFVLGVCALVRDAYARHC
jgi:hypothetical protein